MIPRYSVIEFLGPDAADFLQAQLATDLRSVADHSWRWAALCSVKGRVIATGALMRFDQQSWRWLVCADLAPRLVQHLRLYVLRRKLTIAEVKATYLQVEPIPAPAVHDEQLQRLQVTECGTWVVDQLPVGWRLSLSFEPGAEPAGAVALQPWEAARLRHGMAMIDASTTEAHLAHALSLDRLRAVSVAKGCYPGQEIVARTHYLGQSKRTLALCEGLTKGLAGSNEIKLDGQRIGEIVEKAGDGTALAVVHANALQTAVWEVDNEAIHWRLPELPNTATTQPAGDT